MSSFALAMSSPIRMNFTQGLGGPNSGGHHGPQWYISAGMDLGASAGTDVFAAFDGHVTRFNPHHPARDTDKVFGAQIFMRSANDMMGGFYTHVADVPASVRVGASIARGDRLGKIINRGRGSHLHLALVEIIGGAPSGRYVGVNLYRPFLDKANTTTTMNVTFNQDGTPPSVA